MAITSGASPRGCGDRRARRRVARRPDGYVRGLLSRRTRRGRGRRGLSAPTIPRADFEEALGGVRCTASGGIEPWIVDTRETGTFDDTVAKFEEHVNAGGNDPRLVGSRRSSRTGPVWTSRIRHRATRPPRTTGGAPTIGARRASTRSRCGTSCSSGRSCWRRNRSRVPRACRRRGSGRQPRARQPEDVFKFFVDHQDIPTDRPLRLSVGGRGRVRRIRAAERLPGSFRVGPVGIEQFDWSLEMILGAIPGAKVFRG